MTAGMPRSSVARTDGTPAGTYELRHDDGTNLISLWNTSPATAVGRYVVIPGDFGGNVYLWSFDTDGLYSSGFDL